MIFVKGDVNCPVFKKLKGRYYAFNLKPPLEVGDDCELNIEKVILDNNNEVEKSLFSLFLAVNGINISQFKGLEKYSFYNLLDPKTTFFKVWYKGGTIFMINIVGYAIPLWVEYNYTELGKLMPETPDSITYRVGEGRIVVFQGNDSAFNYIKKRFVPYRKSFSEKIYGIGNLSWVSTLNKVITYNYMSPSNKFLLQVTIHNFEGEQTFPFKCWHEIEDNSVISFNPTILSTNMKIYDLSIVDLLKLRRVKKSKKTKLFNTGVSRDYRFIKYIGKGLVVKAFNAKGELSIIKL